MDSHRTVASVRSSWVQLGADLEWSASSMTSAVSTRPTSRAGARSAVKQVVMLFSSRSDQSV